MIDFRCYHLDMSKSKFTPAQKLLLFKKVHCTKYLRPCSCQFRLEQDKDDGSWNGIKNKTGTFVRKVTANRSTWLCNRKFEIKEKDFEGIAVKIGEIDFSTFLGVEGGCVENQPDENSFRPYEAASSFSNLHPKRKSGAKILAATVFYQNGRKRFVPIECIKEYENFDDGKNLLSINETLEKFINYAPPKNRITMIDQHVFDVQVDTQLSLLDVPVEIEFTPFLIEIENTYCVLADEGDEEKEILEKTRALRLDVTNHKAEVRAEPGNEWFEITDDEYEKILKLMKPKTEERNHFDTMAGCGKTNFERLASFCISPSCYHPQLHVSGRDNDTKSATLAGNAFGADCRDSGEKIEKTEK